ncbi:MAG: hypothetical protein ACREJN_15755, partial [Nitrospiraceae bacterium]
AVLDSHEERPEYPVLFQVPYLSTPYRERPVFGTIIIEEPSRKRHQGSSAICLSPSQMLLIRRAA